MAIRTIRISSSSALVLAAVFAWPAEGRAGVDGARVFTLAGTRTLEDAPGRLATERKPFDRIPGIAIAPRGIVFTADDRLMLLRRDGTLERLAGSYAAGYGGDGGPGLRARFRGPMAVAVQADGGILIADHFNRRIRRLAPSGRITTVAGNGRLGLSGDGGPATAAAIDWPYGVSALSSGGFLVSGFHGVRRVTRGGRISTAAASPLNAAARVAAGRRGGFAVTTFGGVVAVDRSGAGTLIAVIDDPADLAVARGGGLVIADRAHIYGLSPTGALGTLAGAKPRGSPVPFNFGNGRPATRSLDPDRFVEAVAVSSDGGVLFGHSGSLRYLAPRRASYLAAAITAVGRGGVVRWVTSRPAAVRLELIVHGRAIASANGRRARAGSVAVRKPSVRGPATLRLTAHGSDGQVASDQVVVIAGGPLPRSAFGGDSCRRFGAHRVDCRIGEYETSNDYEPCFNTSFRLRRNGLVYSRQYGESDCRDGGYAPYQRRPRWDKGWSWVPL